MQVLFIINLIITSILFIFIIRINKLYKNNINLLTRKLSDINLRVGFMLEKFENHNNDSKFSNASKKNVLNRKFDELDEIISKYLELV